MGGAVAGTSLNFYSALGICHSLLWGNRTGRSVAGLHKLEKKRLNIKLALL